ncbi:protein-disulfide reductase DsbD domain-containing protein [uncultured Aliiroseovarius sp.]|uniref:protein-disulfide reductase DsbD domain-containing protein n=1 Tax=uncultured Aliiroseovarius sp. TaxID=1658783 RepID=UPI002636C18A|nr:protein-disulfide reductase DsbD domain-containing protein [uncultured Aliiroseovarius sp.]
MKIKHALLSACLGALSLITPAAAQADMPPRLEDVAQIDVLPGWRDESGNHMAALRVRLADGWKTYWRSPGEAGIPPSLDWRGSGNLAGVTFHWPVPQVFETSGMQTIGYSHELILPMSLTPRQTGEPIILTGKVNLGVCKDVCMPMDAEISVTLPAEATKAARPIKRALAERPDTAAEAGLRKAICQVEPIKDGLRLTAQIDMPRVGRGEVVVVETADPSLWVNTLSTQRDGRVLTTVADLVPTSGKPFLLNRSDVRLTVLAAGRGVDIRGCTGG